MTTKKQIQKRNIRRMVTIKVVENGYIIESGGGDHVAQSFNALCNWLKDNLHTPDELHEEA